MVSLINIIPYALGAMENPTLEELKEWYGGKLSLETWREISYNHVYVVTVHFLGNWGYCIDREKRKGDYQSWI